jgi:hypothetical protein
MQTSFMYKVLLMCCCIFTTHLVAIGQNSGYSHAKEMGLKGQPKTMKEYQYEAYLDKDSNIEKRGNHYYAITVTQFNPFGNITAKTEYSYSTNYAPKAINDTIASVKKTVYTYNYKTCTGYTTYTNETRTFLCKRTIHNNYNYTDSVYAYIQPGDVATLVRIESKYLNTRYTEDSVKKFNFYDVSIHIGKDKKDVTIYLVPAGHQPVYNMQLVASFNATTDKTGNRKQDAWMFTSPDTSENEYEISEYIYEYY